MRNIIGWHHQTSLILRACEAGVSKDARAVIQRPRPEIDKRPDGWSTGGMRGTAIIAAALLALAAAVRPAGAEEPALHVYNWSDYIAARHGGEFHQGNRHRRHLRRL